MSEHKIHSEIVGTVIAIEVSVGDNITPGEEILVLNSMKMEIGVSSSIDGVVKSIHVSEGDNVKEGELLLVVEAS